MALISGHFCIDRWEAMTAREAEQHSPYHPPRALPVVAMSRPGYVPQAYISFKEADAACTRAGKRLCSTAEWAETCRGTARPARHFPYGFHEQRGACNTEHSSHPVPLLTGGFVRTDSETLNDPRINQLGGTVAPTGAFERCVTPDGVYDLVGNLLEWTRSDRPLLMGGHYVDSRENGTGCTYVTMLHGPDYHDFTTGFRCCKKPEPIEKGAPPPSATPVPEVVPAPPPPAAPPSSVVLKPAAPPGSVVLKPAAPKPAVSAARPEPVVSAAPPEPVVLGPVPPAPAPNTGEARDPPSFRGFADPGGKLPPPLPPPPYSSAAAACPDDMALIEGQRCTVPVQICGRWLDPPDKPQRSCAYFRSPSQCQGGTRSLRFCIDRYEYTPKGYALPLVHVNWTEAQILCGKMEKRLCLEDEWEFACEGTDALPYPYGFERNGALCNHDLGTALFTSDGKLIDRRVPAASLPLCRSPFGVFNLVGNVDEWTTRVDDDLPHRSILRGGWWLTGRNRCRAATDSHGERYAGPQTGFRCCKPARR